jgi:uncharacterized membrane protein YphA (DoxX/SURF4 family)
MDTLLPLLPMVGRILIGSYFVFFGFWNIYHYRPLFTILIEKKIPLPFLILPLGIFWQISAGTIIISGNYVKIAALSLAILTLLSVCIMHDFWNHKAEARRISMAMFITKITIVLGALLILTTDMTII